MNKNERQTGWYFAMLSMALMIAVAGCTTRVVGAKTKLSKPESIVLAEGDVVKIIFPSAPNLDTTSKIRLDGKISLPDIGEVQAAGITTSELEQALKTRYSGQLTSSEISVTIEFSSFYIYMTGAVMHPGKIQSDRPLTALEAIMEAGGADYSRANLKGVIISRKIKGRMEHFKVDLNSVLKGKGSDTFDMRSGDIVFVPEKFSWF